MNTECEKNMAGIFAILIIVCLRIFTDAFIGSPISEAIVKNKIDNYL